MSAPAHNPEGERPLTGGARFLLVAGAGAVMLAFYLFALAAVLLMAVVIGGELVIFVVLARFAAARLMLPTLQKHFALTALLVRSFRLRKGADFRIPLARADAPGLHEMLDRLCQRLALALPQEVVLQMGDVAWVHLEGVRSGAGKTTLGVGYDLLAGLSVAEMEAVLAHEMTHAKLIHRGFRNWLMVGQTRVRTLAVSLWVEVNNARRARQSASVAQFLFGVVDRLLRLCTRLTAAYSRQDEFAADRGAAELCGAAVMKSALAKLESLHQVTSRLPWNERVAQLQQTGGYSQWLLQEIARGAGVAADASQALYNKYSTHPLIRDRLAALPPDDRPANADSPSGIQLLANPDEIAVKLVTALQGLLAEQERKDSQALEKFTRKTGRRTQLRLWQLGGLVVLAMVFGFCGAAGLGFEDIVIVTVLCGLTVVVIGLVAWRYGMKRDRLDLPVPDYGKLTNSAKEKPPKEKIQEMEKALAAELTQRFRQDRGKRRALLLAGESYNALGACDYLRAHVAARECLKYNKKSVEGALALAVACASYGQLPNAGQLLAFVQGQTGFRTFSTAWGSAWAGLLAGDWARAEAMLEKALQLQPQQTTLLSLLAIAQARRGKLQSSIQNARRACAADPASREKTKYLIARLLDGGHTREARERLAQVRAAVESDVELMLSQTQLHLLLGRPQEADAWLPRIKQADSSPQWLVRLGRLYETARLKDQAANLYLEALAADHYPEAHLGLGRLEAGQPDKTMARHHILAALNVDRPVGKDGTGTWQMLQPILAQMLSLHEPVPHCRAWIAAFPNPGPLPALAGQNLMVYAPDLPQAQGHFKTVMEALQPGKPPLVLTPDRWSTAPRPMQPEGPVRPGVQGIWR